MNRFEQLEVRLSRLAHSLKEMVDHYTEFVESGDGGHWNPNSEPPVIAARRLLAEEKAGFDSYVAAPQEQTLEYQRAMSFIDAVFIARTVAQRRDVEDGLHDPTVRELASLKNALFVALGAPK